MNRMLRCLAVSTLACIAALPTAAQERPKGKATAKAAEKAPPRPVEKAPPKCTVDPAVQGAADQVEWDGACGEDGKATGRGILQLLQGGQALQRIEGEFAAGLPTGESAISFANGDRWVGPTVAGRPEGKGTWAFANGDEVAGDYVGGAFRGAVDYKSAKGEKFRGTLRDRLPDGAGVLTLPNGDRIEARFARGVAQAPYTVRFADGRRLVGGLEQGQPQGMGVLHLPDGSVLEGLFAGGTMKGIKRLANKDVLAGEFVNGQLAGKGRIAYADGWTFSGPVAADKPAGRGELARSRGDRASGEVGPDRRIAGNAEREIAGEGRFVGPLGADHSPEGEGTWTTVDGTTIQGAFREGAAEGAGEIRYAAGLAYKGTLQADRPSGQGEMAWPEGSVYRGQFAKGLPHGQGELKLAGGTVYRGGFLAGLPSGEGEIAFADGSRYAGSIANALPDGPGEWRAPSGAVFKGSFRRGQREGTGQVLVPGEKAPVAVALQGDAGVADDGPHFSLFKSKTEEIEGLVRDGFYAWALRYYQQRKDFFAGKRAEHAAVLGRLADGLGLVPAFAFEANRLQARLMLANQSLDPDFTDAAGLDDVMKDLRAIQGRLAATELAGQRPLPASMQAAIAELESLPRAALAQRLTAALAAGDFERATGFLGRLPADTRPTEADRRALGAWLAENPESVAAMAKTLQDVLKRFGPPDVKALAERYRAHFAAAVEHRDIERAIAVWSGAQALGVRFAGDAEARQLADLVEWRLRADPDPAPLFALFEQVGAPAKKASPEGLPLAWLGTLATHVERGDAAATAALIAKAKAFGLDVRHPSIAPRLAEAIESRLQAWDLASYVGTVPALRTLGIDLAPTFKGRVVLLRSGPAGGGKPFPFAIEAIDGLTVDSADDLAQDEAHARQVLASARYIGLVDLHTRHVQRSLADRKSQPSSFPGGVEVQPNPDYAAAERELFALRIEVATINASEAAKKKQADELKALGERIKAIEARLRTLPPTVKQTLESKYDYATLEFEVTRVAPATTYLIDREAGKYRRADFNARLAQRFQTTAGIHPKDEKAKAGPRLDQIRQIDRAFFSARLIDLLPPTNGEGATPPRDIAALPTDLAEQRAARDRALTEDLARAGQDLDGKLAAVIATLHPEVRPREEQAVAFIRVESDIPERNNREVRKLLGSLAAPAKP